MKHSAFFFVLAFAFFAFSASAHAYELATPQVIETGAVVEEGANEADFSRRSKINGVFNLDTLREADAYITVGNVAAGEQGYGFLVRDNSLYLVSHNGVYPHLMPVATFLTVKTFTVEAEYIPGKGIWFDTSAVENFSRGVLLRNLPGASVHRAPALNAAVEASRQALLTVSSWSYVED